MFEKSVYSFQLVTQETMLLHVYIHVITFVYSIYKSTLTFWLSRKLVFKKPAYSFQLVAQVTIHAHFVYGYYKSLKPMSVEFDGS